MSAVAQLPGATTTQTEPPRRKRSLTPYLLLLPGILWLIMFFVVPMLSVGSQSLQTGSVLNGYAMTWRWANYGDVISAYWPEFARSFLYAGITTVACLIISYPLAYAIAFKSGRWRGLMLVAVIAPFFTSFLVRTLAWKTILSDNGFVADILRAVGMLNFTDDRLLNTPIAVVAGMIYNFLPFMVLPLYASLERLDPRLVEAAGDLYANPITAFRKVTFPLSLPGVVAGTLLTFIPSAGDFINQKLLGPVKGTMIGNVIESRFHVINDYPGAAALSFVLLIAIAVLVVLYIRRAGTEELV